jgi:integrase
MHLVNHLKEFARRNDCILYTNSINEEFLEDFIMYLQDIGLKHNYVKSVMDSAKTMAKDAATDGYAIDPTYKNVELDLEENFSIFLSIIDIARIYYFKGLTKQQERIRDLFVIGCLTGLRYSDYSTLKPVNFKEGFITKATKKTKVTVIIPIHDFVAEIYQKYNGDVASGLTTQHFNRYMKMITQKVGFTDKITYTYTRGSELITETKEEWELVSSHTARRSFATNMILSGAETYQVMAITGHTTEKAFFKYMRLTKNDISRQVAGNNFFRK